MRIVFDTNVLVYAVDRNAGERHRRALDLVKRALAADCVLVLQTLAEFYSVATSKVRLTSKGIVEFLAELRRVFPVHAADERALDDAIDAVDRHSLSFWDALLWATARRAQCDVILGEDFQDGRKLGGVTFINPFVAANDALIDQALPR